MNTLLRTDMLREHNAVVRLTDTMEHPLHLKIGTYLVTYRFPDGGRLRVDVHVRPRPGEVERYIEIAKSLGYTVVGVARVRNLKVTSA